ncbi:hypothetical protein D3C76_515970 [compost metagenome]|uniref:Uncharacterized protein n=1 Tax=Pseudomonas putida S12 TaxID=1215087 RepID=A0AA34RRH0_PSEPU|nr:MULTISPECIES: hypothetical protein [Pseudomonas]AJA12150.1 hypothetical protein RPPX_01980 [Pseudomonas putida S12]AOX08221.1 hypothetical protein Q5O_07430 [Pseudomonas putida JB]MCI1022572.1 hypothetical protein [Pseudomonas putida]MDN4514437.1 hypothetical protein [Pseudomonas sp. 2,4-D]PWY46911.1 hypothetical protein DK184_20455 [Pseudomonas sp. RW405]
MIWTAETPIVLYGAAHRGTMVSRYLRASCNVTGFIDKRAAEIERHEGLPVTSVGHADKSALVIICVNNIFEHESIALGLAAEGFERVIFCPVNGSNMSWRSAEDRAQMAKLHNHIIDEQLTLPVEIPALRGLFHPDYKDDALISDASGDVLAWIPALLVCARRNGNGLFQDSPVFTLFPYLELFKWFDGEAGATPDHYMDLYCRNAADQFGIAQTAAWVDNVLRSRRQVYERMRQTESIDPLFFLNHAVKADWNSEENHFNMDSGKHRAAFQIHRKRSLVPLKLSSADYEAYLNHPALKALIDCMVRSGITELPYPVMHSYFLRAPYRAESAYYETLLKLCRVLVLRNFSETGRVSLRGVHLRAESADLEPLAQAFALLGCSIHYAYQESEFDRGVRDLYRISDRFAQSAAALEAYDFLLDEWVAR